MYQVVELQRLNFILSSITVTKPSAVRDSQANSLSVVQELFQLTRGGGAKRDMKMREILFYPVSKESKGDAII